MFFNCSQHDSTRPNRVIKVHMISPLCSKPLPQAEPGRHIQNNLDKQMQFYRELELEYIRNEATKLRENATDLSEALNEVENYLAQLKNLATEVIWLKE